jgi:tetratricopeptide (TPR) repeat protein
MSYRFKARTSVFCLALALVTLALYWPVSTYDFLNYDDPLYVTENARVLAGLRWGNVVWAFSTFHTGNWHPLTWLSLMLDCQWFGPRAAVAHFVNVVFHLANSVLLFLVCKRLTGALWPSALVAALFAMHPGHVESVAWVAERKDVLSGFFFLLTLLAYTQYAQSAATSPRSAAQSPKSKVQSRKAGAKRQGVPGTGPGIASKLQHPASSIQPPASIVQHPGRHLTLPVVPGYVLALLCFALGLMSKPMLVTVPFVLLLLDYWPLKRLQAGLAAAAPEKLLPLVWEKLPFFALSAVSSVVTFLAQRTEGAVNSMDEVSLGGRLANVLVSYVRYAGKLLWPRNLSILYVHQGNWPVGAVAGSMLVLAAISAGVLWLGRSRGYLAVGWLWFLGMLVPVNGLVQVGLQAMADRYTYLPSIGLFVALIWGLGELAAAWRWRTTAWAAGAALVLVICACLTHRQLRYWQNSETIFRHALEVTPNNYVAFNNLGLYLFNQGKLEEAIQCYRKAVELGGNHGDVLENLGTALSAQGQLEEAVKCYETSLRYNWPTAQTHSSLGALLVQLGRVEEAMAHFDQALKLDPGSPAAHRNLGHALASQGKYPEAIVQYRAALEAWPDDLESRCSLGKVLADMGDLKEAIRQQRLVLQTNPGHLGARNNLGIALAKQGNLAEAIQQFRETIRLDPNYASAHRNLGKALAAQHQLEAAIQEYRETVRLRPGDLQTRLELAWVLATAPQSELRNGPEAVQLATGAAKIAGTNNLRTLDTLAAAYAEAGRFAEAGAAARQAQALAVARGQPELAKAIEQRLMLYQANQPYRDAEALK